MYTSFSRKLKVKNWRITLRIIYFIISIVIDVYSNIINEKKEKNKNEKNDNIHLLTHIFSWTLSIISLFPYPLYGNYKENNIVFKIFLHIFPFYILLTRSYEGIFLIIFYNYLQIWIKLRWRKKNKKIKNFNLIDIFIYMFLVYFSFFGTGNVASISGFTLSSVFRFITLYWPMVITTLIMIKIILPLLFITSALFEICITYGYSGSDSLLVLTAFCEVMNIKFFFDIRDSGSWREIGMSIAFFIISNVVSSIQFLSYLIVKIIFWAEDKKYKALKKVNRINKSKGIEVISLNESFIKL